MNRIIVVFIFILTVMVTPKNFAQSIAKLTLLHVENKIEAPVYIDLDNLTSVADSSLVLQQLVSGKKCRLPSR